MTRTELQKLFHREKARFAAHAPWCSAAKLRVTGGRCVSRGHCAFRDLAYVDLDDEEITLHVRALTMSKANVVGLLRHELGHLADVRVEQRGSERRADLIAEFVSGEPVRYDARDVQTTGRGRSRPKYLPR